MTSIVGERVKQAIAGTAIALGGLSVATYLANTETAPAVAYAFEHFSLSPERATYDALPPDQQAVQDARFTTDISEHRTAYLDLAILTITPGVWRFRKSRRNIKAERTRREHPEWF